MLTWRCTSLGLPLSYTGPSFRYSLHLPTALRIPPHQPAQVDLGVLQQALVALHLLELAPQLRTPALPELHLPTTARLHPSATTHQPAQVDLGIL